MAAYRYGHPGYSWLARVVAFGSVSLLPVVLPLLNLIGMGVAGAGCLARGARPWLLPRGGGLVVALNPGLVTQPRSTRASLSPPDQGVVLLWLRGARVAHFP